jgi:ATP-dependent DNA helicase PIF1
MSKYDRENEIKKLTRDGAGNEKLYLKLNTPVMCTMNVDLENGIYNGSQGKVIEFRESTEHGLLPVVKFNNGKVMEMEPYCWQSDEYPMVGVKQVPLQLAWAMTIHKSQGSSLDNVIMNLGNQIFEYGQSYVALSRVRTLDGLYLSGLAHERIKANPIVNEFYDSLQT